MDKYTKILLIAVALNIALWIGLAIYNATLCAGYVCRG